jgi:hypothetical protein
MKRKHPTSKGIKPADAEVVELPHHAQIRKETKLHKDIVAYLKGIKYEGLFHSCTREGNAQICRKMEAGVPVLCGLFFDRTSPELGTNPSAFLEDVNASKATTLVIVIETFDATQDKWFGELCVLLQEKLAYSPDHIFVIWEFSTFCDSLDWDRFLGFIKNSLVLKKRARIHFCSGTEIKQSFGTE